MAREIIIEIHRIGAFVKATAVDAQTGEEASVSGPVTADPAYLKKLACDKLMRRLKDKNVT